MFEVGIALIGLIAWLFVTSVINILCYGLITLGVTFEWLVAGALGADLILGMLGQWIVTRLIKSIREFNKEVNE